MAAPTTDACNAENGVSWGWRLAILAACCFNLLAYYPELALGPPDGNDHVYHYGLVLEMLSALQEGRNPLDPWIQDWGQGFPLLRYYQYLPHLLVVVLYKLLGGVVELHTCLKIVNLAAITLIPATLFHGFRLLGHDRLTATLACWMSVVLAVAGKRYLFGLQAGAYVVWGPGLFTQAVAAAVLGPAIGYVYRVATSGTGALRAVIWMSLLWLCHLVVAYFAALCTILAIIEPPHQGSRWKVAARLSAVLAAVAAVTAQMWLPTLLESRWISRSQFESPIYWESFGGSEAIRLLLTGGLFDGPRMPILSVLVLVGAFFAFAGDREYRTPAARFSVYGAALAFVALIGPATLNRTFGSHSLDWLPFARNLPWHRSIVLVHWFGLALAGLGLKVLWQEIRRIEGLGSRAAWAVIVCLLLPLLAGTWTTRNVHVRNMTRAAHLLGAEKQDLDGAMREIASAAKQRPARAYGGTSWDWGQQHKLGGVPVYAFWTQYAMPNISYQYHTMSPISELEVYFDPQRHSHYDLFNIGYLLFPSDRPLPDFAQPRASVGRFAVGAVDTSGAVSVVGVSHSVDARAASWRQYHQFNRQFIQSPWHETGRHVRIDWQTAGAILPELYIDDDLPTLDATEWHRPRGRVFASTVSKDRYAARLELDDPGHAMFRVTFHPGWQAQVDGESATPIMVAPGYLAVPLGRGQHQVTLQWRPWRGRIPLVALALVLLAAGAMVMRVRERRRVKLG